MPPSAPGAHVAPVWHPFVPSQQAAPSAPHALQTFGSAPAGSAHARPAPHVSPSQQASPAPPHFAQTFGLAPGGSTQPRPEPQTSPPQQDCPAPPHGAHAIPPSLAWHDRPALHSFIGPPPAQHAWPVPPQATQVPLSHRAPEAVQVPPSPASLAPQHG
jgi:hypothetical protein